MRDTLINNRADLLCVYADPDTRRVCQEVTSKENCYCVSHQQFLDTNITRRWLELLIEQRSRAGLFFLGASLEDASLNELDLADRLFRR
jgi:hypothetical protein